MRRKCEIVSDFYVTILNFCHYFYLYSEHVFLTGLDVGL